MQTRKHFELREVWRIPVHVSAEAQEILNKSNHQGRLFPQALAEAFGAIRAVTDIAIDIVRKGDIFPDHPEPADLLFHIVADHFLNDVPDHGWYLNVHELYPLDPKSRLPIFNAKLMAEELVRLYPHTEAKTRYFE